MITIPDVPYMIVLGTSHTAGQCDVNEDPNENFLDTTFAEHIANDLGLELVKIGIPGCTNIELLFSFNKLVDRGFITNENMKLFILEPRLLEGSTRIPIESIFVKDANKIIESNLKRERYKTDNEEGINFKEAYNIFSLYFSSHSDENIDNTYSGILDDINDPIGGNYKLPPETKYVLRDFKNFLIHYGNSYQQFLDNLIVINSILNQLEFLNKKYFWLTFNILDMEHRFIADNCVSPKIRKTLVVDNITNKLYRLKYNNILCPCSHLNENGHKIFYDVIKNRIRKRFYDKTT